MKILLIQLRRVGDVLLTAPMATLLRRKFPGAKIDFLTEKPADQVLLNHPDLNEVLLYDSASPLRRVRQIRARRYDWVFDFLSNPRSAIVTGLSGAPHRAGFPIHVWSAMFNHLVPRPPSERYIVLQKQELLAPLIGAERDALLRPHLTFSPAEAEASTRLWDSLKLPDGSPVLAIIPTHRHAIRRWTPEGFAGVAQQLVRNHSLVPLLFWGPGEEETIRQVESRLSGAVFRIPPVNLREMAGLLRRCRLVLTNDNGPMHLAVAVGTPTVTVYGPTDPASWNPRDARNLAVRLEGLHCIACNLNRCPYAHECMNDLKAAPVTAACETLLRSLS